MTQWPCAMACFPLNVTTPSDSFAFEVHRPTEDEVYRTNDTVLSSDKAIRQLEKYKRHAFNAADGNICALCLF